MAEKFPCTAKFSSAVKRGRLRKTNQMGSSTVDRITRAAREILITEGTEGFSVDKIARKAGVTKGTLLYHFQNKAALVELLMKQHIAHLQSEFERGKAKALKAKKSQTSAQLTVNALVECYRSLINQGGTGSNVGLSLLALAVQDEVIRKPLADWYGQLLASLQIEDDPVAAKAILVMEGLFLWSHMGITPISEGTVEKILASLA